MYFEDWSGKPEPTQKAAGTTGIMRYDALQAPYATADTLTMPSRIFARDAWLMLGDSTQRNAKGGVKF